MWDSGAKNICAFFFVSQYALNNIFIISRTHKKDKIK